MVNQVPLGCLDRVIRQAKPGQQIAIKNNGMVIGYFHATIPFEPQELREEVVYVLEEAQQQAYHRKLPVFDEPQKAIAYLHSYVKSR